MMFLAGTTACFTYSFYMERRENQLAKEARGEPDNLPPGVQRVLPSGALLMSAHANVRTPELLPECCNVRVHAINHILRAGDGRVQAPGASGR